MQVQNHFGFSCSSSESVIADVTTGIYEAFELSLHADAFEFFKITGSFIQFLLKSDHFVFAYYLFILCVIKLQMVFLVSTLNPCLDFKYSFIISNLYS